MTEWYDNDTFWHEMGPAIFTDQRMKDAVGEAQHVAKLLELAPGAAVLDLACGAGRHSVEFAKLGYRVTGVDRTAEYLKQAEAHGMNASVEVEWIEADMRTFRRPAAFDAITSLLSSFGYFREVAEDAAVLTNAFANLKPDGQLLIDLVGKEVLARVFRSRDWQQLPDGSILLEHRELESGWGALNVHWQLFTPDNERHVQRFKLRLYSAAELTALLQQVGFTTVTANGSYAGTPYDQEAERLVVVARKTAAANL